MQGCFLDYIFSGVCDNAVAIRCLLHFIVRNMCLLLAYIDMSLAPIEVMLCELPCDCLIRLI